MTALQEYQKALESLYLERAFLASTNPEEQEILSSAEQFLRI